MNKTNIIYALGGLILGGIAIWSLCVYSPVISNQRINTPGISQNNNTLDAHFIEQMIPHHEDAITMAKLAQTNAKRPEIKQMAEDIITSQGAEISQMKNWYGEWFGKDLPTGKEVMNTHGMMSNNSGMHMGVTGDASDLEKLEKSADFDKAFVEHMIPHHQMAVMMASMLKGGTSRPEMKKLADDIINAQTKEIDQMRSWLKTWE